jgi:hypothetical protein
VQFPILIINDTMLIKFIPTLFEDACYDLNQMFTYFGNFHSFVVK